MILKGRVNGKDVYSYEGEKLRGKDITCGYCSAKMYVKAFPRRENEFYLALKPGEEHTSVCNHYEKKNMPILKKSSPEIFIGKLCEPANSRSGGGHGGGNDGGVGPKLPPDEFALKEMTSLAQMINAGLYYENPFEKTFLGSQYRFIDFAILDKWAKYIWTNNDLCNIGHRIVDTRWVGSFAGAAEAAIEDMEDTHRMWTQMFWSMDNKLNYKNVRFCLDIDDCYYDVLRMLFVPIEKMNGTYKFKPRHEKMDFLIAAKWEMLTKQECLDMCPIHKCKGCLGAYWGKGRSKKQIEFFLQNALTKNKGSSLYNKD